MTAHCCKAILIPCPRCESPAGTACIKPFRYGGVVTRQCHIARANAFVKVCTLLNAPAMLQEYSGGCAFYSPPLHFQSIRDALMDMVIRIHAPNSRRVRVSLLNGTVIREWEALPPPIHTAETCRDPACECWPF